MNRMETWEGSAEVGLIEGERRGEERVDPRAGKCYSLAFYKTTPRPMFYIVSVMMILCHLMFLYGQLFPMWRLYYHNSGNITIWPDDKNWKAKELFVAMNLSTPHNFQFNNGTDIKTFTYGAAIKELWKGTNLDSKFSARFAAVVLILFSGIWPHVKLLSLHYFWLTKSVCERTRTTAFYWLSTFGKWSLADVFVVCIMIGVLNLDMVIDPDMIRTGLIDQLPRLIKIAETIIPSDEAKQKICVDALKLDCSGMFHFKCSACKTFVGMLWKDSNVKRLSNLGVETLNGVKSSGGGHLELRVAGLHGIYVFCFAVILSLTLSFVIDTADHHAKAKNAKARRHLDGALGASGSPSLITASMPNTQEGSVGAYETRVLLIRRISRKVFSLKAYILLILGAITSCVLIVFGILEDTMERTVPGSLPQLANEILGVEWEKPYSLWTLTEVVGAYKGPDYLLMGTFAFFIVLGPLLRTFIMTIDLIVPASKSQHKRLMTIINFLGAFCAWEVFLVALFLVDMEMPTITNTIINDKDTDLCKILYQVGYDRSCLQIEFHVWNSFVLVILGGTALMQAASLTVKLSFKALNPYMDNDRGGPYCCESCPGILMNFDDDLPQEEGDIVFTESEQSDERTLST
mmetsp:Transcript_4865/g.7360  ORF Transcript_4865/g.7360 Transcript_4865/m.7360 type:complete len:632 (+) Transcript_4865:529-2424(+)